MSCSGRGRCTFPFYHQHWAAVYQGLPGGIPCTPHRYLCAATEGQQFYFLLMRVHQPHQDNDASSLCGSLGTRSQSARRQL